MKIPVNRKESYMGETPPSFDDSKNLFLKTKLEKDEEEVHTILLLDTPQPTPVGSPEPQSSNLVDKKPGDLFGEDACEAFEKLELDNLEVKDDNIHSAVKRSAPVPISDRRNRRRRRECTDPDGFSTHYRLMDDLLGKGASGSVATCINIASGGEFAVKTVMKTTGRLRERILREIDILHQGRKHPNIVQLISFFEESDRFLLIFEKCLGGSLLNYIKNQPVFTEYDASIIIKDIASALKFLHSKGIAHRDLKPDNILCHSMKEASPVKLCDFDLACGVKEGEDQALLTPVGSATFMAPEVVNAFIGKGSAYDKKCDLWSLGVVLYIIMCGYPPFRGVCDDENCQTNCNDCKNILFEKIQKGQYKFYEREWHYVSGAAKDLVDKLLIKDNSQRYSADNVLRHPWVFYGGPDTELFSATSFSNENSDELKRVTESCNAFMRHDDFNSNCYQDSSNGAVGGQFRLSPLSDSSLLIRRQRGSLVKSAENNNNN